jgi:hypothetical protein
MIEGFRIEVTADELGRHLDERITHHHERAADYERRAKELEALTGSPLDDDDEGMMRCWGIDDQMERKATRHRDREALLVYLRNHLVAGEVYRLTEADLRSLELFPVELKAL